MVHTCSHLLFAMFCFLCVLLVLPSCCRGQQIIKLRDYVTRPLCGDGEGTVTYHLENYPPLSTMTHSTVDSEVDDSFSAWTTAANNSLRFVKSEHGNEADIIVSFQPRRHNCVRRGCRLTQAFPHSDMVLAHSFNPDGGSEVHMNGRITWIRDCSDLHHMTDWRRRGQIAVLREILTHEIGHAIGIRHIKSSQTIMELGYRVCGGKSVSIGNLDYQIMNIVKNYCHLNIQ